MSRDPHKSFFQLSVKMRKRTFKSKLTLRTRSYRTTVKNKIINLLITATLLSLTYMKEMTVVSCQKLL